MGSGSLAGEPPISAELWARLKRFDPRCFIAFQRTRPYWRRDLSHLPRIWLVTVHAHDAKAWEYLHAENVSLSDALIEALTHGEKMGWDKPL